MSNENTYEFKAEIKKLLYILSQSLYQNKEIFLREIISNSADALKKLNFMKIQGKDISDADLELKIEILFDPEKKTITVSDSGIGMTKEELINNLGTIAGSGSEKFMQALKESQDKKNGEVDLDIIGQFGVGFYSVFMVADHVKVITKAPQKDAISYEWDSDGSGAFSINEIEKETRGTDVIIFLKEEENEYLNQYRLESIIKKYSNFVSYPIFVSGIESDKNKMEVDMGDDDEEESSADADGAEESNESDNDAEPEEPAKREPVNEIEPIWKKNKADVKDIDYQNFYHYISNKYDNYGHMIKYNVDGRVQFKTLLFIPESRTKDIMQPETEFGLTLYSKNVMIIKKCKDLIPQYFRFICGIVDSEDIPLNVSRDTIQNNRTIIKMKELIQKRIFKELNELAENDKEKYISLWKEFGIFIKEGIVTDMLRKDELLKLVRFETSKSNGELISLEDYISRMPEGQTKIYYLIGENMNTIKISPHLGYYKEKDMEVIFLDQTIDNFMLMNIHDYRKEEGEGDDKKEIIYTFHSIDESEKSADDKEDGEEKEDTDKKEEDEPELSEDAKKFIDGVKDILGDKIMDAKMSDRLYGNSCRLANPANGMTSSMQRAMRFWTQNGSEKGFELPKKILEMNPNHPIISGLIALYAKSPENGKISAVVNQMFENCLLSEGDLPEPSLMVPRINQLLEMLITGNDDVKNAADSFEKKEEPKNSSEEEKTEESEA